MRLIDADALKEKAHKEFQYFEITLKDIDGLIKSAPTIEPAQGKWIPSPNIMECVVCSRCNSDNLSAQVVDLPPPWYHFCPNCGAKMKGGEA